ncbi:diacylglycerol/lipid kinase family protein [Rhabdochromatium marinum]|uniref:diacylglycerol/lipid kinase family protein n=1 Tax=Rhabdochromatium marinum TaxID=48729 RepID=UPI0019061235|nr:diacylglycerol kinase family protein [Rhabdochromatium marinum]MBK1648581.1 hypothetical protein [Rhabdochromatium marinum]
MAESDVPPPGRSPEETELSAGKDASFWSRAGTGDTGAGRVLLVVNPSAGDREQAESVETPLVARLRSGLAVQGVQLDTLLFDPQGFTWTLREYLREHLEARQGDNLLAIYIFGGDGTVLAVVEALDGQSVPIGIVPCGTMNWLARDLDLPLDPEAAVQALLAPRTRQIDVGWVNGHVFLCACMLGVAPLLARYRERLRERSRWWRWPAVFFKALQLWGRYPHLRMTLVTDDPYQYRRHPHQLRSRTLVVVNNRIDRLLRLLPYRPQLDAGVLELYAMRRATLRRLRALLGHLMSGDWNMDDVLLMQTGQAMRVELAGQGTLSVLLDGEIRHLRTPLRFSIKPRALTVLVPPAVTAEGG